MPSKRVSALPSTVKAKNPWTPEEDKLLGTATDAEIGRRLGRKEIAVRQRRKRLRIPPSRYVKPWTKEENRLLGILPDAELARRFGRSLIGVTGHREWLKIPAPPRPNHKPWTAAEGRPAFVVAYRRRILKITPFIGSHRVWTQAEDELLGTMADRRLARRLKRTFHSVRSRRIKKGIPVFNPRNHIWKPEDDKILGTRPDEQVALLLGVTLQSVYHRRHRLGILLRPRCKKVSRPVVSDKLTYG